jgi:hypothetical protein
VIAVAAAPDGLWGRDRIRWVPPVAAHMAGVRNVGGTDRLLRAALAVALGAVAAVALSTGRNTLAVVAGAGALGAAFNAVTCFCGINAALGIDTTED